MSKYAERFNWFWREWVRPLLVVGFVLFSFRSAVADWNDVPSGSMRPTILEGERVFVNKLAYDLKVPFTTWHITEWSDPARGDVVVLYSPHDGRRLIKRVVGIPGDTIEMNDHKLTVNGVPSRYQPLAPDALPGIEDGGLLFIETTEGRAHPIQVIPARPQMPSFGPVKVPAGQYMLMGDNRDNSLDSRYWGFAGRDRIVGRATLVVASVDINNGWKPRWSRFFSQLK